MIPKFRAYFNDTKELVKWEELQTFKGLITMFVEDEKHESFALMQATGLQDRNGADIYEGDIVSFRDGRIAVIIFEFGMFGFMTQEMIRYKGEFTDNFEPLISWHDVSEVIGNIYENPNILEENQ